MGSVKDLTIIKKPTDSELGVGKFTFSDRYSVFDWGEMPDHIPEKGTALNMMAAYNFVELRNTGIPSHFISLYSGERSDTDDFDPGRPVNTMYVQLTRVLPIENDYIEFQADHPHYLLPVEIIFRNGAPKGSSLFRRLDKARGDQAKFEALLHSLNLTKEPSPGDMFPEPVYDFTTKLESTDRAISYEEAQRISGLSGEAFDALLNLARRTNAFITEKAEQAGLEHFDGKIEAMKFQNDIRLVDVLGTFDENRFMYDGEQVSKEILRQAYKHYQPDWVAELDRAKQEAAAQDDPDWKSYCQRSPEPLPAELITLVSRIYKAGANLYTRQPIFEDVPELGELIPELKARKEKLAG